MGALAAAGARAERPIEVSHVRTMSDRARLCQLLSGKQRGGTAALAASADIVSRGVKPTLRYVHIGLRGSFFKRRARGLTRSSLRRSGPSPGHLRIS